MFFFFPRCSLYTAEFVTTHKHTIIRNNTTTAYRDLSIDNPSDERAKKSYIREATKEKEQEIVGKGEGEKRSSRREGLR